MKISPSQSWRLKNTLYSLMLGICKKCGNVFYPYQGICGKCGSVDVEKVKAKGTGTLLEYTVLYQTRDGFEKQVPIVIGLIRLDEGVDIVAPLTDVEVNEIKEGVRVEAVLRRLRSDSVNGLIQYGIKFRVIDNAGYN
ncbi:Zn-ribbon domain-containing OB-fold protein [Stygiolobus azoricus]|uniref:DNA-binding protein n=1 Tax=Stygiolobus azoricus TaxID=41675 RepID=A0A650CPF0_9CREN|nr:Zn-ribbon domain-containing OB-fold protein [Stygiolobus azoricus]QGR19377.1 DNA-binding protein [Stygiolobus azoricus]